jgi:hypothetical protein
MKQEGIKKGRRMKKENKEGRKKEIKKGGGK